MTLAELIQSRTSVAKLTTPVPDDATLKEAFACALRAPDHRVLRPWRFLTIKEEGLQALGELFVQASQHDTPSLEEAEIERLRKMPLRAPLIIVAIASYKDDPKVPHDEQLLSSGAAIQNFLLALHAKGFASMWRTGPLAEHPVVKAGLQLSDQEKIAGFIYAGSPATELRSPQPLTIHSFVKAWPV